MESIARFDQQHFGEFAGGAEAATLQQIEDAHRQYTGFGDTGGFAFARREGDNIIFLHSHRGGLERPKPVPFDSQLAEPMRRALRGERGTIVGPDYLGTEVLAAYEPVAELDMGIVAKIDMAEVCAPFIRAGLAAAGTGLLVVILGAAFFVGLTNPMIQRLQRSEHESRTLAAIVQSSNDAIIGKNLDGTIQTWNDAAEQMYGYSRDEVVGKPTTILVSPDRHDEVATILKRISHGERVDPFETVRLRKDGQPIHVSLAVSPIEDGAGRIVGASTIARDIMDRKRAEDALHDRETRMSTVLDTAVDAIITIGDRATVESLNQAACRLFGFAADEVIGENVKMLMPQPYRDEHDQYIRNYLESGEAKIIGIGREVVGRRKDGSTFPMHLAVSEVQLSDRHLFTGIVRDISDLKDAQEKLVQSERLAAMGQMLSAIAHESRNALQRIQAGVDMLEFEVEEQSEANEDLGRIARAGEDLQRLFDELRSYAAPIKLETSKCSLSSVWRRAWTHLEAARDGREVELHEEMNGVDLTCAVDAFRVEQVFRNLMENSLGACGDPVCIEAHQGTIRVGECLHGGAEFQITLPRSS